MLRSLDSGVSALQQFQQQMDVIGNNIANVDTVGFKGSSVSFADTFSQSMGSSSNGSMQVGTGVLTSGIKNKFIQGSITNTGVKDDLAVSGNGFFTVSDPVNGAQYVTRDGHFNVDKDGYLVTGTGMRVQGYTAFDSTGAGTTTGDIKIDNTGATMIDPISGLPVPDPSLVGSYSFGTDGKLTVRLEDGKSFTRGQILLKTFTSPEQLMKEGNNLYSDLAAAGASALTVPSVNGPGTLATSSLEMSNVDLAGEMASLITTQRAFQANAKIITTSDEMLQELVNLKR